MLIVDEIHTALSPKYRNVFFNIQHNQIMGLTATKPHNAEYYQFLQLICPIVYTKTIEDALDIKAISNYMTFNLEVKMNRRDRSRYRIFDSQLKRAQLELLLIKKHDPSMANLTVFDIAKQFSTHKSDRDSGLIKYSKQFWSAMTMRKWVCYEAESKIAAIVSILEKFPHRKWIIFNKSIKFAELTKQTLDTRQYRSGIYHSKMKKNEREQILKDFEEGKIQYLIAVDALNAGLNIPDIDAAICVSGVSTELTNIQQLGRIVRFREGKSALFVNLYCNDSIEETWVKNKTKALNNCLWVTNVKSINEPSKHPTASARAR